MRKLLLGALILLTIVPTIAETRLHISGRVKSALTKYDLTDAIAILYDSLGQPTDTCRANRGLRYGRDQGIDTIATYSFNVPRCDSTYVIDIECEGYTTHTITYEVKNVGKREYYREIPMVLLQRAPKQLGEVTVTTSKIKFYNKGDTVVFNADAFQLAEGSMLDGLISMLPGVELKDGGQIYFNGEYVESLLLNGRKFLDGNNQLMLENIGAYTVKNVEVYKGQTDQDKWWGDSLSNKILTMNVKLKKEYNNGWIINAQGGFGTEDRYNGRLFASWFSPTTGITLVANANNLNDNRRPGNNDTWTPERMPSGTKRYHMGAVNYDYKSLDEKRSAMGHLTYEQTRNFNTSTTNRTNFLTGGDTYDYRYDRSKVKDMKLETRHYFNKMTESFYLSGMALGRMITNNNDGSGVSGTFNEEQAEMTKKTLEAIYTDGSPQQIEEIVNRSITSTDGSSHTYDLQLFPYISWKIPGTSDGLSWEPGVKYSDKKEERWKDYLINFGSDPVPAERRRQYFDNSPNRSLTLMSNLSYRTSLPQSIGLRLNYEYRFFNQDRDSYMYALDRLEDMGVFGQVPAGYLDCFDPANSYTSRTIENTHTVDLRLTRYFWTDKYRLYICLNPSLAFRHSRLDYWRDNRNYFIKRDFFLFTLPKYGLNIEYATGKVGTDSRRPKFKHTFKYEAQLNPTAPRLMDMIDVTDNSDPLNITEGNPDLKTAYKQSHTLSWTFSTENPESPLSNTLRLNYNSTSNAQTRGYTYDTSTGIRHTRTYNVQGNYDWGANNHFRFQFGKNNQLWLSSSTMATFTDYADMVGINKDAPELYKVSSRYLSQSIRFGWTLGKQSLEAVGEVVNRHSESTREDFRIIDANNFRYGITGQFQLPVGFGINTDFMVYTRTGYGMKEIDKTSPIWNVRLTYKPTFDHRRWLFMVDAFDMLHQLSNYTYSVSATGRTVAYTNALPRYVLFSVQYRLNIQPKKKK